MSSIRQRFFGTGTKDVNTTSGDVGEIEIQDGNLKYVVEKGGNDSLPSYQEASGAPVEVNSPLGYTVGPITIVFLNISKMVGTGVYSTPSTILKCTGSVGLSMIYWFLGLLTTISSFCVYLEFASYFPNRSGSEVVYLEQAYPRPRYFFPIAFAVQTVILSFSSGNSIVLAEYLVKINGHTATNWQLKGIAIAGYTVAVLLVIFQTRFSYMLSNGIGIVKTLTLIFIAITGFVVLGGHTKAHTTNFDHSFESTSTTPYGLTNALYKIIFSYAGFQNAFNVVNETKNPVKRLRTYGFISIFVVTVLYILANVAYFAAVPKAQLAASSQVAASLFFQNVFGSSNAVRGLNFLIALSAFGNLVAVLIGQSRLIRECGRQGILPWPAFWASTKPFGTPLGLYFIKWAVTIIMILAPPAGDAFNFITDLQVYPTSVFNFLMSVGLYIVRYHRKRLNVPRSDFRAWDIVVIFSIIVNLYLIIMPWYPPATGRDGGDVTFWYATYVVTGISIFVLCGIYYILWIYVVPKFRGYRIRQEALILDNGAVSHRLVKVPVDKLIEWDATHGAVGHTIGQHVENNGYGGDNGYVDTKEVKNVDVANI